MVVNGTQKCVVGPSILVDGSTINYRNGTVVNLPVQIAATDTDVGPNGGTLVSANGTRVTFNSKGLIAIIYPNQGREVFANGTVVSFPACPYVVNAETDVPHGLFGANATTWYTLPPSGASGSMVVYFYANGTCSASPVTNPKIIVLSVDQNGDPISGFHMVLAYAFPDPNSGAYIDSGYTPYTFGNTTSYTLQPGTSYQITAESYGSCTFTGWVGGNPNQTYQFDVSGLPGQKQTFTAEYSC